MENNAITRIGFWKRVVAYLIDLLVSLLMGLVLITAFGKGMNAKDDQFSIVGFMFSFGMYVHACYIPIVCMDALMGQTPGKMILGIKIANADGTRATLGILTGRAVLKYLQSICSIIFAFSGIWLFATLKNITAPIVLIGYCLSLGKAKQALHDMVLKTAVFKKSDIQ